MRVKTDEKRRAIITAAGEVFREMGYAGASMAAVCERIGGSKATLYRYFPSKEELFVTILLDSALDRASQVFETLSHTLDLRKSLERFGRLYLELALTDEVIAVRRNLIAEGHRAGIGQMLYERSVQVTWAKMADYLAEEIGRGRLRPESPWIMAMHLRGLLEGDLIGRALIGADVDRRTATLRAHAARVADLILRAFGDTS